MEQEKGGLTSPPFVRLSRSNDGRYCATFCSRQLWRISM